jgi:two-component system, sensor histidine kinase YesM
MRRFVLWIYKLYSQNIQVRLTCYFLLILLPLVAVSLFANARSQSILLEQTTERTESALASSMDYIDVTLQNLEEISTLLATDSSLIRLLEQMDKELTPQAVVNFSDVLKQLSNVGSVNHMISQITIYHALSNRMVSTAYGGRRIAGQEQRDWLEQTALKTGTGILYLPPGHRITDKITFGSLTGTDSVSLVRTMDLYNRDRTPNMLILSLNKNRLLDLIKALALPNNAKIYLFSEDGQLVAATGGAADQLAASGAADDGNLTVKVNSRYSKWSIMMVQPKSALYGKTDQLRLFTYIIIAVSVLLAFCIAWAVYSGIASPVKKLSHGMKRLGSGNFDIRLDVNRKDEFGYLTRSFNQMVQYQKHLIEDHYEQQLRLVHTELKFLQSQINPHFLYNTLDSIYWSAKNYEADEISEMVLNLSRFFRLSLNKDSSTFTVEETVNHLHYYIRVQQIRFLDNFTVDYDIQEDSRNVPLLKLLLQPLVENAILHGLEGKQQGGKLLVGTRVEESFLLLYVQDNGSGMKRERLAYIRSELSGLAEGQIPKSFEEGSVKDLYGLRNVVSRIRLYYGNQARFEMDSTEGEGTVVKVYLPLDRCNREISSYAAPPLSPAKENAV